MAADNENQEAEDESEEEDVEPEVAVKDNDTELEAAIAAIRANKDLPRPPYPTLPNLNSAATMSAKVSSVQTYIEKLSYNFTGVNYFDVRKHRPLGRILETGREITRQALPIKCVEAVFVAMYLTQGVKDLERIPMSFKSMVDGVTYKHIVLVLKHNSKWGTVGLSRRRELYYKDLVYDSLAEIFLEYKRSYERVFHTLKRVKVGLPISHEVYAGENVCWAYLTAKCSDVAAASQHLAEHGRTAHKLHDQWKVECKRATSQGIKPPNPPTAKKKETSAKRAGGGGHAKSDSDSDAELADAPTKTVEAPAAAPAKPSFLAV
mmetsp:Transcript_15696/g.35175  ORF Transcript_15696/g.35175 Transcript_15696/m.35175 type:complete len:320 (-) Transcript_15696:505-1464(-)|eukprot:CAMPEP_0181200602 /NCGR_PEP_ID=MMETSP1096-20121128/17857_1 /TAXON_ID=156174 ORGANISM="Chrysochromulina ericina, Strain CCMP281" /NCGR_SAMPLE_ID=MMETSP1096 /ASSEMBLY_ACC=CAM_ASM_000453 /LENGTH=319 /DNA_ID=CAMNT_0023290981 /DNA_START=76 /DNA_END=1035 /DNA_ORIENTATION=-